MRKKSFCQSRMGVLYSVLFGSKHCLNFEKRRKIKRIPGDGLRFLEATVSCTQIQRRMYLNCHSSVCWGLTG